MHRAVLLALVFSPALGFSTVPSGWIDDYRNGQNLKSYLRQKYQDAEAAHLVPYVYWYGDWCRPCRQLRRMVDSDPAFRAVFAGTRIVMLEFDLSRGDPDLPPAFDLGVPIIAPINEDGTIGSPVLNGIPWNRGVPRDVKERLCSLFALRYIPGVKVERGCPDNAPN